MLLAFGVTVLQEPGMPALVRGLCWFAIGLSVSCFFGFGRVTLRRYRAEHR